MPTYKPEDLFVGLYQLLKTPQEMFEVYENYQQMFSMFDFLSKRGFVLDVKEFGNEPPDPNYILTGGKLLKYFFSLHSDRIIADDQANEFAPIFYVQIFSHLPDDDINGTDIKDLLQKDNSFWELIKTMFDYSTLLTPLLKQELEKLHDQHPELADKNKIQLRDLQALIFAYKPYTEKELEPLFKICRESETVTTKYFEYTYSAVKAAKQAVTSKIKPEEQEELLREKNLLQTKKNTDIPIVPELIGFTHYIMASDKLNNTLLNIPIGIKTKLKVESNDDQTKGLRANTYVLINFDNLEDLKISKTLEPYDQDIIEAISNVILNQINNGFSAPFLMTPNLIYEVMPKSKSKLNATERKKIDACISKLKHGDIFINNSEEIEIYDKYDRVVDEYPILDIRKTKRAYYKGKITKQVYSFNDLPIIFKYAYERKQITTIRKEIAETPLKLTAATSKLLRYLRWRIDRINHRIECNNKIMMSKLYEKCGAKTPKQKERLIERLPEELKHYKDTEFIKDYEISKDSIIITPNYKADDKK